MATDALIDGTTSRPLGAGELLLAVDAGGTKTAAWLVDPARPEAECVLGCGRSSAGNPLSVGFAEATRVIVEAVAGARADAHRLDGRVSRAILSIAGAANKTVHSQFVAWAREIGLARRVAIVSDVLPVLAAGTPDCCGLALIAGTGSVAFARTPDGRTMRCGGWGYLLGDEGSGYAIGRAGLQHALLDLESSKSCSPLAEAVLDALGADSVLGVTRTIYRSADQRGAIAALALVVIDAAEDGDADAQAIMDAAAVDLAKLAARTVRSIGITGGPIPLAIAGGAIVSSVRLRRQLDVALQRIGLPCEVKVVDEPLEGCVRLATAAPCAAFVTWH